MIPTAIKLNQKTKTLELTYDNKTATLSCYHLRLNTPSADKPKVVDPEINITAIEPVGNYALKLIFSDGHQSGLYTWEILASLSQ